MKEHYDSHLGNVYSWMVGDFSIKQHEQEEFFRSNNIIPHATRVAIDLGAGHGLQSVSLARLGFAVKAVDFNRQLLEELRHNADGLNVEVFEDDLKNVRRFAGERPELIVCCGDTLTHLASRDEVRQLLAACHATLVHGGRLVLTFRDYSLELAGDARFIPVRSDEGRILTCFLEFFADTVRVTDLLHERTASGWRQQVGSYTKLRLPVQDVSNTLLDAGMSIDARTNVGGTIAIIATKKGEPPHENS